jgi:PAS domain S-box-containing protein
MFSDFLNNPKFFQRLVETFPIGVYIVDRERIIRFWNQGAEHITGYLTHEVVGHVLEDVVQACDRNGNNFHGEERPVTVTLNERRALHSSVFFLHKSGHRVPVEFRTLPLAERGGGMEGVAVIFEEVYAYREESSEPAMYGCLDAVRRIPSQRLTRALLYECITGMEKTRVSFGLVHIRVLGLEDFSKKHGPQSIAPFMRTAARTLRHSLHTENFLGCWGEYEFLAVLESASPVTVATTAETLWNLLSHSEVLWWGDRFLVKSEVAYTLATVGKDLEELLREMKPAHSSGLIGTPDVGRNATPIGAGNGAGAGAANHSVRPRG